MRKIFSRDGFALIYAIWVMAILTAVIVAFAWNQQHEVVLAAQTMHSIRARYLAEAGLNIAVAEIKASWDVGTPVVVPSNTCYNGWDSTDNTKGSPWSRYGTWSSNRDWEMAGISGSSYFLPSTKTTCDPKDEGYFMLAIEDESGKVHINSNKTAAQREDMILRSQGRATASTAADGSVTGSVLLAADCANIANDVGHRTIPELGFIPGIGRSTAYSQIKYLTPYPPAASRPGFTYDMSGKININSASDSCLRAVMRASGVFLNLTEARQVIAARKDSPFNSLADFSTRMQAAPYSWTAANATLDANYVRFDSLGWFRVVVCGVAIAQGTPTNMTARAIIEAIVKTSFESDPFPVQIVYWREWFAIPVIA